MRDKRWILCEMKEYRSKEIYWYIYIYDMTELMSLFASASEAFIRRNNLLCPRYKWTNDALYKFREIWMMITIKPRKMQL